MTNKLRLNYFVCPGCKNVLDLLFAGKVCPNPLCGFNFEGLTALLDKSEGELQKALTEAHKNQNERDIKLLATAVRFNIPAYLADFIGYSWGSQMQRLFKDFIQNYLNDVNTLKIVLASDIIKPDKGGAILSKNGYKMFPDLYDWLIKTHSQEIRGFLRLEFPELYREHYKKWLSKYKKERQPIVTNQSSLV